MSKSKVVAPSFSIMDKGTTLAEAKTNIKKVSISTIDDAVTALCIMSANKTFEEHVKPQAIAHLDACAKCDVHTSSNGLSVKKVEIGKVYNSTKKIVELEASIARLQDSISSKRLMLTALKKAAGIKVDSTKHYWRPVV